ncbi:MmgE/PrpD family protein [Mesorhizobium sp. LNHC252B00]|uniref:MmgE/PrpD family protein n=1 Tax=Mesorhizobium sp. LNHC252B00 TaxID=1287252 RepID=UPI0003CEAA14|nr:MmgE/PrpD family protein [Mesorhizobium sp. LNHC252B00]ESY63175.1 MmgE/PrpD family protein [Mesorhizobium sp. LNHC252B00]
MTSSQFIEKAADFVVGARSAQISDQTVSAAQEAFVDYLAVALGGCNEPVSNNVFSWASERSFGSVCSIIGRTERLDPENAAFCNAVAGHALDFDDTSWSTIGHPTTVVAPAAIAIGETVNASGRDVLIAYLVGVEVAHRLADVSMPHVSEKGWHTTSVYYAIGAAAAACVLLGLDHTTTISALGLSISRASGVRANFGTQAKPYHAGMTARNGLEAVSLARAGVTASATAIEGADGFLDCFAGNSTSYVKRIASLTFGAPFDLVSRGVAYKRYPCCSGSHPACDLMLELVVEHNLKPEDIAVINVGVSLLAERELICHEPSTPQQARFSMEFALAAAIAKQEVTLATFHSEVVADAQVRDLMSKVRLRLDDELAQLGFIGTAPVKLEIALIDGRVLRSSRDLAIGNPERPFSDSDRKGKFMMCAVRQLDEKAAAQAYDALQRFQTWNDVPTGLQVVCR